MCELDDHILVFNTFVDKTVITVSNKESLGAWEQENYLFYPRRIILVEIHVNLDIYVSYRLYDYVEYFFFFYKRTI